MINTEVQIRVRYKETDAMGVVHHSNYVNYYEVARTEMLRGLGTTYRELEASGVMLPVVGVNMQFFTPAMYDDLLTVKLAIAELPAVRMKFEHEVYNGQGELVNRGEVTLVYMNAETRRACRAPQWLLDIFRPYFD